MIMLREIVMALKIDKMLATKLVMVYGMQIWYLLADYPADISVDELANQIKVIGIYAH